MKLFLELRNIYEMLDINPSQHKDKKIRFSLFTSKICLSVSVLIVSFFLTGIYCLFQSKTMREFGDSFYAAATVPGVMILVSIFIYNIAEVFKLIEHFEEFMKKSKYYQHLNFHLKISNVKMFNCNRVLFLKDYIIRNQSSFIWNHVKELRKWRE